METTIAIKGDWFLDLMEDGSYRVCFHEFVKLKTRNIVHAMQIFVEKSSGIALDVKPNGYPYICTTPEGDSFIPTMVDYENSMVWRQNGQASGNGEWISFEDVEFKRKK